MNQQDCTSGDKNRRWWVLGLAMFALVAALILVWTSEDLADVSRTAEASIAPPVSYLPITVGPAVAQVHSFAELRPRWDAEIRSSVGGQIVAVHDSALAGARVEAGEPLFDLETTQYETAVAAAELQLEEAHLALWQAKNAVTVARAEFDRTGTKPPNELALRLPQLRIAERSVNAAQTQLEAARERLEDTVVTAPFSGFVTQRMASLGQTVTAGEPLVSLADDVTLEAVVEIKQLDWSKLAHPIADTSVELFHRNGAFLGRAVVREGGGFLDVATRQRRVFLDVETAAAKVLAGDFVRVRFPGRHYEETFTVPESAITREGYIWFIDKGNQLARSTPEVLFRSGQRVTLAAPEARRELKVVVTPMASFLPGQKVTPQPAREHDLTGFSDGQTPIALLAASEGL